MRANFFKFFLRCADADVERYLKLFTFLPMSVIKSTMEQHETDQSKRVAQHKLAYEFVELVHGLTNAQEAEARIRHAPSVESTNAIADMLENWTRRSAVGLPSVPFNAPAG